jgi:hypothetical protein
MQMLTVTDADRALANELGLLLHKHDETDQDRTAAADPRATRTPETWTVFAGSRARPVGRLHFTAVDCLYASKYAAGISGLEETVADALRWIAPIVRHVRTGEYDGTETIVMQRTGKIFERPRAITECGAKATGADYNPIAAQSELINGRSHEMCPACRQKLEARGAKDLSHLPERSSSSTARQRDYIRRLLDEGARNGRPYLMEARDIDQMSSRGASAAIDKLKSLKERGWKGAL